MLFREDEQERRRDAGHVFVQQLVPGPHEDFAGQKLLHLNQPPFDTLRQPVMTTNNQLNQGSVLSNV